MDGSEVVIGLRWAFLTAWAVPAALLTPSAARCFLKRGKSRDAVRQASWCVAVVMVLFALRWVWFDHPEMIMSAPEVQFWAGLYFIGALCSAVLFSAVWLDD